MLGTVTHTARRQAGIARRALGEMAMWGADPLRARDAADGVAPHGAPGARPASAGRARRPEGQRLTAVAQRSRHRHLEVLSFPLDEALAAAKGLGGSLNDWFVTGVVNGAIGYHDERGVPLTTLQHELRRQHAHRQGDRRQLLHAVPAVGAGRARWTPRERFAEISARMQANRGRGVGPGH